MRGSAWLTRTWGQRGPVAWLLWPVSILYGAAEAVRHLLYKGGIFKSRRVAVPVVVVGNVVAGGAGKTPVVMAVVKHLQARGWQTGVVSRGYGRDTRDCREVMPDSLANQVGDEPLLIKKATSAPVFVAIKRADAAAALLAKYPQTRVIVCDDGLQHYALHRDIEICVFDEGGIGNGLLLPAGPLREAWPRRLAPSGPGSAGTTLVLHTGSRSAFTGGFRGQRSLASQAISADGSVTLLSSLRARPLAAVAAIARPDQFFNMLRDQGLTLAHTESLPDHFTFDSWRFLFDGGYPLICTEKDAVKLWRHRPDALAVPLVLTLEPAFLSALEVCLTRVAGGLAPAVPDA